MRFGLTRRTMKETPDRFKEKLQDVKLRIGFALLIRMTWHSHWGICPGVAAERAPPPGTCALWRGQ